jgi:cytochrome c
MREPGLGLMRRSTCFACHTARDASAGPPYLEVSRKYQTDPDARERLARKIIDGGSGVWGQASMMPNPQHRIEETRQMVDWILSLARRNEPAPISGYEGLLTAPSLPAAELLGGVWVLEASYTDDGAGPAPPLRGESRLALHPRRKRAAFHDASHGVEIVDVFEGGDGLVARTSHDGWVRFDAMNLRGVNRVAFRAAPLTPHPARVELRIDSEAGPVLAKLPIAPASGNQLTFSEATLPIRDPGGQHHLVLTARAEAGVSGRIVDLSWIEFLK